MLDQYLVPHLLQAFFLIAASTTLLVNSVSAIRSRFIAYGVRATTPKANDRKRIDEGSRPIQQIVHSHVEPWDQILDRLAALQVPHHYFFHFYIVSVLSSLFWGYELLTQSHVLRTVCQNAAVGSPGRSMSMEQIELSCSLLGVQGTRRLVESIVFAKSSASKMWFVHWLIGILFYLAVGISIWIEGADTLVSADTVFSSLTLSAPSFRTILCIPVFILASGIQHDCHAYLASLKRYTLPTHPIFQLLICPHYAAECLIYLSLALISAPKGAWINQTMFTALVFVAANLSVTAKSSKVWYENKFGKEAVAGRWIMVPFVW